jgi:hypothetical protein
VCAKRFGDVQMNRGEGSDKPGDGGCRGLRFGSAEALAVSLRELADDKLAGIVGKAGTRRIRHGKVALCDLLVGALRCGKDPVALFDDVL